MKTVRRLAREVTGKEVAVANFPNYYFIGPGHLEVPGGRRKKEQTIHEVCHWVVAEDWQREHPENLGFGHSQDGYEFKDARCTKRMEGRQELMACHVQRLIYRFAGKPWPTYGSCNFKGRDKGLTDAEVAWMMTRCGEAGWGRLVGMARGKW